MTWFLPVVIVILLIALGEAAWRLAHFHGKLGRFTGTIRKIAEGDWPVFDLPKDEPDLEELSNAIILLAGSERERTLKVETERARLAAVLERMTDGVLIANADGRIQYSNPAAAGLFESPEPTGRTVAEVLRHYQLVEAWRRCPQGRELQNESVELPNRHLFLQLVAIPEQATRQALQPEHLVLST